MSGNLQVISLLRLKFKTKIILYLLYECVADCKKIDDFFKTINRVLERFFYEFLDNFISGTLSLHIEYNI